MISREASIILIMISVFVLLGVIWFWVALHPRKYSRVSIWLCLTFVLFALYTVFILLLVAKWDLLNLIAAATISLFGSVLTTIGIWIPMHEREWITKWFGSRSEKSKPKRSK